LLLEKAEVVEGSARTGLPPGWQRSRAVLSLWDLMLDFEVDVITEFVRLLEVLRNITALHGEEPVEENHEGNALLVRSGITVANLGTWARGVQLILTSDAAAGLLRLLSRRTGVPVANKWAKEFGLSDLASKIIDGFDAVARPRITYRELQNEIDGAHRVLSLELRNIRFFAMTSAEASSYSDPWTGWSDALDRFPSSATDIAEAGKCLAASRYTACVFHLMRILEVGLRSLGKSLNDPRLDPKTNPSWDRILSKCDDEQRKPLRDRSAEWKSDEKFFSTATATLRAVKDAWRNPTMHVERRYDEDEAREVYAAARGFMRHIAKKLTE